MTSPSTVADRLRRPLLPLAGLAAAAAAAAFVLHGPAPHAASGVALDLASAAGSRALTRPGEPGWAARIEDVRVRNEWRRALILDAPGTWSLRLPRAAEARLAFAWNVEPNDAPATLGLSLASAAPGEAPLLAASWSPGATWQEQTLRVPSSSGGEDVELRLSIEGAPARVALGSPHLLARSEAGPEPPNVILYVVDALRADHVGAYGYPRDTTPHLDALARSGVVFEQVFTCAPWTKPSVACLFTSLYPVRHGVRTHEAALGPDPVTLAEAFAARGYETAAWVANPLVTSTPGLMRGFQRVLLTEDVPKDRNINDLEADAGRITTDLVAWLRRGAGRRFFLYVHSLDLHAGYRRRAPFDRDLVRPGATGLDLDRDLYDTELAANDRELGRLVRMLRRLNLYDRTILAVTSDHGEEFGERGPTRHGRSVNDALLRTPLVVKLAGGRHGGRRTPVLASNVDLGPTLLDLAGLPREGAFTGSSLAPALAAGTPGPSSRTVFTELLGPKETLYSARDERFKYVLELVPSPRQALFDVAQDPAETHDLASAPPAQARDLMARLSRFVQQGQRGYHISATPRRPGSSLTLHVTTPGEIASVARFQQDIGDVMALSADRHTLSYSVPAAETGRRLILDVSPDDAPLRLSILEAGVPLPSSAVVVGRGGAAPASHPLDVRPGDATVDLDTAARLASDERPGARIWRVQPPAPAEASAELTESLRVLGYLDAAAETPTPSARP